MNAPSTRRGAALVALLVGIAIPSDHASAQRVAVGVRAGTLGFGGEVTASVTRKLNVRVGMNQFSYARQDDQDTFELDTPIAVAFDTDAKLANVTGMVDFLPFNNFFRLSAGMMLNNLESTTLIRPTEAYTYDNKTFSVEKIGTLNAVLDYERKAAPYVGIGFGNAAKQTGRIALTADLGVFHTGAPRFQMTGTSMIAPTASQAQSIEDGMKDFVWYPQFSLGLAFRVR